MNAEQARQVAGYLFAARRWGSFLELITTGRVVPGHAPDEQGTLRYRISFKGGDGSGSAGGNRGADGRWSSAHSMETKVDPSIVAVYPDFPDSASINAPRAFVRQDTDNLQFACSPGVTTTSSTIQMMPSSCFIVETAGGTSDRGLRIPNFARAAQDDAVIFDGAITIYAPFGLGPTVLATIMTASGTDASTDTRHK